MTAEGLAGVVGERVGCGGEGFITMSATWHYGPSLATFWLQVLSQAADLGFVVREG